MRPKKPTGVARPDNEPPLAQGKTMRASAMLHDLAGKFTYE